MTSPSLWRRVEWSAWIFAFLVWTVLLLRPEPGTFQQTVVPSFWRYPLAKSLHLGFYALLSGWGLRLVRGNDLRVLPWLSWWPVGLLSLHGAVTECLQTMVKDRTGSVMDVGWDHLGILVGWTIWRLCVPFQLASARSQNNISGQHCAAPPKSDEPERVPTTGPTGAAQ